MVAGMRDQSPKQPHQLGRWAVWVKVDDGVGWRIVHETDSGIESCLQMAMTHVIHQYPVLNVEVREESDDPGEDCTTTKLYEFPGDMP
jgi:hypothetical protein